MPLACGLGDHSKIGGGGTGSAGHPEPGGGGTIGGTAGTGGTSAGTAGTVGSGGALGIAGNAAGTAGDSGSPGAAGTSGSGGDGAGTAGVSGTAGGGGVGPGSAGASGAAGTGGGGTGTGGSSAAGNLIANGDFSAGSTNWHTENGTGNVNNGAYCVGSPSGTTLVGWDAPAGSPVTLSSGTSYRFSFQASGSGTVHLKIGMAAAPYDMIFQADHAVSSSLQTFTDNFTPATSNTAGLAFTFVNAGTSTVCIDNVALTAN